MVGSKVNHAQGRHAAHVRDSSTLLVICWFGLLFLTKTREGINTSDHAPDFFGG